MAFFKRPAAHLILIAVMAFLAYSNTLHAPFVFDDLTSITGNPVIRDLGRFLDGDGYRYNPRRFVGYLTLALNYRMGGLDVAGYHLFNLAVHIGCAQMVYLLLRLTLATPFFAGERGGPSVRDLHMRDLAPLLAALLFALHPVQTQAVTYTIQRLASLATLFYLVSIVLYIRGRLAQRRDGASGTALLCYLCSLLSAMLAMRTKEISFTLPAAVALHEFFFFGVTARKRIALAAATLLAPLSGLIAVITSGSSPGRLLNDVADATRLETSIPRLDYLFTQCRVLVTYLRLLIFPARQNLDYDYPVYATLLSAPVLLSLLLLLSLLALALYLFLRSSTCPGRETAGNPATTGRGDERLLSFGILWFFLTLSVESSVIPIADLIFEHRLYLPAVGASVCAAILLFRLVSRFPGWNSRCAVIALLLVLCLATRQRNAVWQAPLTLWNDVVSKSPAKARPHLNLGSELMRLGRTDEAMAQFQDAVRLKPDYAEAYANLGGACNSKGLYDRAIEQLGVALRLNPDNADALNNVGTSFAMKGEPELAIAYLQAALRLAPENGRYRYNLATAYRQQATAAAPDNGPTAAGPQ